MRCTGSNRRYRTTAVLISVLVPVLLSKLEVSNIFKINAPVCTVGETSNNFRASALAMRPGVLPPDVVREKINAKKAATLIGVTVSNGLVTYLLTCALIRQC